MKTLIILERSLTPNSDKKANNVSDRIMIKRLNQKPTQEDMAQLWGVVVSWIEHKKPTCPESIYQNEICSSSTIELVEEVCDIVGYWED